MEDIEYRRPDRRLWLATGAFFSLLTVLGQLTVWGFYPDWPFLRAVIFSVFFAACTIYPALVSFDLALTRTVLEAGGLRIQRPWRRRFHAWTDIVAITVVGSGHYEVQLELTDSSLLRLPAPLASWASMDPQFRHSVGEMRRRQRAATDTRAAPSSPGADRPGGPAGRGTAAGQSPR
ncbi:PH domain-containing protein [Streptomyces sp. NRRL F-2890]|uniref:PH domain-containing protein n=1 Tax=Streptomyces sp. NRRL F-2890 TaxID=1463845 RepID=UPI00131A4D5F|nr:PH domain-containing protein [Streptomyces sp. NRRL F-2890]